MQVKAIFFDLGETIFNYGRIVINVFFKQGSQLTYDYFQQIAPLHNAQLPPFKWYHLNHLLSIRYHYVCSMVNNREFDCLQLLRKKAQAMGFNLTRPELEDLCHLWYEPLGKIATIEPDLKQTLTTLRQMSIKLAILSNTFLPGIVLDRHLEQFGLKDLFHKRIYSSDTIWRKPDHRIYQAALEQVGVSAQNCIMVGDRIKEDVKGPGKLGIKGIFKRGSTNDHRKIPPQIPFIDRIAELPALLQQNKI